MSAEDDRARMTLQDGDPPRLLLNIGDEVIDSMDLEESGEYEILDPHGKVWARVDAR